MSRREYAGAAPVANLAAAIAAGTLAFTVTSGGGNGYPTGGVGPFFVVLDEGTADEEKVLIANRSGDLFNVTGSGRGADGTTAVGHDEGATVRHIFTATDADEANAHVNAVVNIHGRTGALVSENDAQTLTNKTISGASNTFSNIAQSAVTNLVSDQATQDARLTTAETDITNLEAADVALDARLDKLETNPSIQVFESSGTWNKPANLRAVRVRVVGGGASGGGAEATGAGEVSIGGGGGGGGYAEKYILAAALGATVTVTVGAGGAASSGGGNGNGGGTSSFGAHLSATGGSAGAGGVATSGNAHASAGIGGEGSSGDINVGGSPGRAGRVLGAVLILENGGGDSPLGGGGRHTSGTGNSAAGRPYGGGGSGTCVNTGSAPLQNSVASVPGVVIVENIF